MQNPFDQDFWNERYASCQTGWDLGAVSPPLKEIIDHEKRKDISLLLPGCGNAYEAAYLLDSGFQGLTLLDISDVLVNGLKKMLSAYEGKGLRILCEDFFAHVGAYDLVLEQTFFCALDPSMRRQYVVQMHKLLKPNGRLTGVLFNREFEGGPPFGGTEPEYRELFEPYFTILRMEPCLSSVKPRLGNELIFEMRRKG